MNIPFELHTLAITALVVVAAYIIFGISAFGAALFTVPVLSHFYPLDFVLPTCVLLDVAASLAGAVLGVTLLVSVPRQATLFAFGLFLLAYGVYALRPNTGTAKMISRAWAPVAGFAGGATGTLFGIGAPPYAIYLTRRVES